MVHFEITSPANERIKRLVRLRQRRHRDDEGVFLVEGPRLLERALEAGLEPLEVYTDGSVDIDGMERAVSVEPSALDKASYRRSSQGVIAVFTQFQWTLGDVPLSDPPLVVVTEAIEKPGNLGAVMRTAAAAGVDALVSVDPTTDLFNPNVVRASTGALFSLPAVTTDLSSLRSWLDLNSMRLLATSPSATTTMWESDLRGPCAVMIGAEDLGLSAAALDLADDTIVIPMRSGVVDSLNSSVTLALVTYEAVRQRSADT